MAQRKQTPSDGSVFSGRGFCRTVVGWQNWRKEMPNATCYIKEYYIKNMPCLPGLGGLLHPRSGGYSSARCGGHSASRSGRFASVQFGVAHRRTRNVPRPHERLPPVTPTFTTRQLGALRRSSPAWFSWQLLCPFWWMESQSPGTGKDLK